MSNTMSSELSAYQNWIIPANGKPPHLVDFREFYHGRRLSELDGRSARFWKGDFEGSFTLADDFRRVIIGKRYDESAYHSYSSAWRNVPRFLAENTDLPTPISITEIDDVYGTRLKRWLGDRGLGRNIYKRIKAIVDAHFQVEHGCNSLMPLPDSQDDPNVEAFDLRGIQMLNLELRKLGRDVKANFKEGRELSQLGRERWESSDAPHWNEREYHAYFLSKLTQSSVPSKEAILQSGGGGLIYNTGVKAATIYGPINTLPLQGDNARAGIVGKLRWFFPAKSDTATFLWMILILTGFNYSSTLNIDITDETTWWLTSLKSETRGRIIAYKGRSDAEVFAPSDTSAEYHAYKIIKFMVSVTEPLRATLRKQHEELVVRNSANFSYELVAAIARAEAMIKSPWLYLSLGEAGNVLAFEEQDSSWLNTFVREVAGAAKLTDDHPYLKSITTRQPRKSLLEYTNETSGSFMAAIAGGHSDWRSLRYYLSRRRRKIESFQTVRTVVGQVIDDIEAKRPIDAAKIKILLARGEITAEQAARLADIRQRTRLGMGCLNPQNPPKNIAHKHKPDTFCRVQRCTGCIHGVIFPESIPELASHLYDLDFIKRQTPMLSWAGSSFEAEHRSIVQTLEQFDRGTVDAHYKARKIQIESGNGVVLDGFASF